MGQQHGEPYWCACSRVYQISTKMMVSTEVGKTMSREDLLSLHYIEATCTSRWALGFVLAHCIPQSGKLGSADTARLCEQQMQAFVIHG